MSTPPSEIRPLRRDELDGAGFDRLLWRAAEVEPDERRRIVRDELGSMTVLGAVTGDGILAFAAFHARGPLIELEYIATSDASQGRGLGTALIHAVRAATPGRALHAETDDDAVDFYRRLGFTVTPRAERDPRWPDRPRYDCVLAAEDDATQDRAKTTSTSTGLSSGSTGTPTAERA